MENESIALATERARARLNQKLIESVQADFDAGGAEVVAWLRKDRPLEYLKLVRLALTTDDADGRSVVNTKTRKPWSQMFAHFARLGRQSGRN